jgi:hypothetical protein
LNPEPAQEWADFSEIGSELLFQSDQSRSKKLTQSRKIIAFNIGDIRSTSARLCRKSCLDIIADQCIDKIAVRLNLANRPD